MPPGYEDRTTNLFVPQDTTTHSNLSVARDWLKDGELLDAYVDRQLALLKARLAGHKLLDRQPEQLGAGEGALSGERIDASYRNGQRAVHQRQAVFLVAPRRALIFTASSPGALDDAFESFWRTWLEGYESVGGSGDEAADAS